MLGLYGEALQIHERTGRYDPNTIRKWRNEIYQVANKSGYALGSAMGENSTFIVNIDIGNVHI